MESCHRPIQHAIDLFFKVCGKKCVEEAIVEAISLVGERLPPNLNLMVRILWPLVRMTLYLYLFIVTSA